MYAEENENYLFLFNVICGSIDDRASFLRVHSIDEYESAQPRSQAERPCIKYLLLRDDCTFVHHRPYIEHS